MSPSVAFESWEPRVCTSRYALSHRAYCTIVARFFGVDKRRGLSTVGFEPYLLIFHACINSSCTLLSSVVLRLVWCVFYLFIRVDDSSDPPGDRKDVCQPCRNRCHDKRLRSIDNGLMYNQ